MQGFKAIRRGDAEGVKEALFTKGPLAVSIDAAQPTFRFYSSGVYNDPSCKHKQARPRHRLCCPCVPPTCDSLEKAVALAPVSGPGQPAGRIGP